VYSSVVSLTIAIPVGNYERDKSNIFHYLDQLHSLNAKIILIIDDPKFVLSEDLEEKLVGLGREKVVVIKYDGRNPGGARNLAIKIADTSWIQFCDSDDYSAIEGTLKLLESARYEKCDAIIAGFIYREALSEEVPAKQVNLESNMINRVFGIVKNPGIWRWIFRTDVVKDCKFPETRMAEDQVFISRFLARNPVLFFKNDVIYTYNTNVSGSLTSNFQSDELDKSLKYFSTLRIQNLSWQNLSLICLLYHKLIYSRDKRKHARSRSRNLLLAIRFIGNSVISTMLIKARIRNTIGNYEGK
jgi:glycosyltransferase involved in cell wall biosynthesis